VLNFACWASAASWLAFAILYFPNTKLRTIATIDVVMAVIVAAIPLLHRFGPRIAGLVTSAGSAQSPVSGRKMGPGRSGLEIRWFR
jgi:hypothetical protein